MEHRTNSKSPLAIVTERPIEIVRADASDYFRGYAAIWYDGTAATEYRPLPNVRERINPSAFNAVIERGDEVEGWYNHDPSYVLGSTSSQSLFLETDERGLRFTIPFDAADPQHVTVRRKIEKGIATGASFQALASATMRKQGSSYVRSLDNVTALREVSIVNRAAYRSTEKHLSFQTLRSEIQNYEQTQKRITRSRLL